ncbi:MAG: autotransporter domain-containing protein [Pseudomonadota bacterium]
MPKHAKSARARFLISVAWKVMAALFVASPAMAVTTQDDVSSDSVLDTTNTYNNVGGLIILNPDIPAGFADFCTGTLINPRTVLTATHCVRNSAGTEIYTSTGPYTVRFRLDPNGAAPSIFATDVIVPQGANAALFPDQDFTIVALGQAVPDIKGAPVLLSPLTQETLATMVGYGTFGTGSNPDEGFDFRRRVTTNVIQYLGSFANFDDDTFGAGSGVGDSTQFLYWADFDRVGRQSFFDDPLGIDYDPLPGDAVQGGTPKTTEGNTGPGDSGGPLFASVNGKNYLAGVLSGGLSIWIDGDGNGLFGYYGTETYWNPVFEYANFLIANNPYKYVHALRGDGDWTDPKHWEQTLDPGYVILDKHGNPVNGIPKSAPNDDDIQWGTFRNVFDVFDGGDGLPDSAQVAVTDDVQTASLASVGGASATSEHYGGGAGSGGNGNRPASLQGPGSRNFVPNNTDGAPGTEFANPAQYFDVTFDNSGTTRLKNAAIQIDHLTVSNPQAELDIKSNGSLLVNLESEIQFGQINVDGALATRSLFNTFGVLSGKGSITTTNGVFNIGGVVSPGDGQIGTLTINGNYTQGPYGTMLFQISNSSTDLLKVNGTATMDGNLLVASSRRLTYGQRFTVVQATSVVGNFDNVYGSGTLLYGRTIADGDSIDLVIDAHKMHDFCPNGRWSSLASAIDFLRDGHYFGLQDVFNLIDNTQIADFDRVLPAVTPNNALTMVPLASNYSEGFITNLTSRTAELRAGARGISQQSVLNGLRIAQDSSSDNDGFGNQNADLTRGANPNQIDLGDNFGMFIAGQGNLADADTQTYSGDRYNPLQLSESNMANMTVGADYRVNHHFAIGVAGTITKYLQRADRFTPLDQHSYGVTAYATLWEGNWHLDSYAGIAKQSYAINRPVTTYGLPTTAGGEPDATQSLAGVRTGWSFQPIAGLNIGPTIGLAYSQLRMQAYDEVGGGDFDLNVDGRTLTSLTVETSLEMTYQPIHHGVAANFAGYGRVGLVNALGDTNDVVRAAFAAAPDVPFEITQSLDKHWVNAAMGVTYQLGDNTSAHLEAVSDMGRDNLSSTSVNLGFNFNF